MRTITKHIFTNRIIQNPALCIVPRAPEECISCFCSGNKNMTFSLGKKSEVNTIDLIQKIFPIANKIYEFHWKTNKEISNKTAYQPRNGFSL